MCFDVPGLSPVDDADGNESGSNDDDDDDDANDDDQRSKDIDKNGSKDGNYFSCTFIVCGNKSRFL